MTRKELMQMIEDEVYGALQSTVTEPVPTQSVKPVKPVQTRADLSNEELDEVIFFGGEKPKNNNDDDFNINKNK